MLTLNRYALSIIIFLCNFPAIAENSDFTRQEYSDSNEESSYFDPIFLSIKDAKNIDLSRFDKEGSIIPGSYPVDLYVNGLNTGREVIAFSEQQDKSIQPCLSLNIIKKINFNYDNFPNDVTKDLVGEQQCIYPASLPAQSTVNFDSGLQRLDITIPQAYLQNSARGSVNPELWDEGVPAIFLGYGINGYTNTYRGKMLNSAFAGLNAGINLGRWYFRHNGNYSWQEREGDKYQALNTNVQRDIPVIKGRLLAGQISTRGRLFNTLSFKGVELFSVNQMLPGSKRGYAPDIRGVAKTNAKVTIRQNNRVIYEQTVPPGAFNINDLFPTGYGGNLDVTVTEADGNVQHFQVPYASVTQLLRPGSHQYDVVIGKLDDNSFSTKPALFQVTYQRGLSNLLTGYTGLQASQRYRAFQSGIALSTSLGAFSIDITQARTQLKSKNKETQTGQSYQLGYSKYIPKTDSNLTIAAYRYSTSRYMDYMTAMRSIDAENRYQNSDNVWRPKNRFTVTVNQGLPEDWGQIYATGYTQDYWNQNDSDLQYQVGYNNNYDSISYSASVGRVRNGNASMETNIMFSMSVPFGSNDKPHTPQMNLGINSGSNGQTGEQVGISGTAGDDYQYSYGITGINYNKGQGSSLALNGQYRNPYNVLSGSYGAGKNYQNTSASISGTVLAWQEGIVMTPYTSNTFAIVDAPGATGAKVSGHSGIKIDPWGHAAIPSLNPYEMNDVIINPKGSSYDVELENTSQRIAPYEGAVVTLKFSTKKGYPVLILAKQNNGQPLPFGADVFDNQGNNVGAVGQNGQVYARVQTAQGVLSIKWGDDSKQQCQLNYQFRLNKKQSNRSIGIIKTYGTCQ